MLEPREFAEQKVRDVAVSEKLEQSGFWRARGATSPLAIASLALTRVGTGSSGTGAARAKATSPLNVLMLVSRSGAATPSSDAEIQETRALAIIDTQGKILCHLAELKVVSDNVDLTTALSEFQPAVIGSMRPIPKFAGMTSNVTFRFRARYKIRVGK